MFLNLDMFGKGKEEKRKEDENEEKVKEEEEEEEQIEDILEVEKVLFLSYFWCGITTIFISLQPDIWITNSEIVASVHLLSIENMFMLM